MKFTLGIDAGGTFTDSVIIDKDCQKIIGKAKAFTTRPNLSIGIEKCLDKLPSRFFKNISLVCLSTTLATNTIVEGKRGKTGVFLLGDLPESELPTDICICLKGRLDIKGREREAVDRVDVLNELRQIKDKVDAIAVSGFASVRNPAHEILVKELVQEETSIPVVCAHELTSDLGFYERTVTAALNAGLVPIIRGLIEAVKITLKEKQILAPLMIVKGDGSLIHETLAMDTPVDTIFSGPAASISGGIFLSKQKEGIVMDMGGTTTDIARIREGKAAIKKTGAKVGGWNTRIRAAELYTVGIGGDSRISYSQGSVKIGPKRVCPLCVKGSIYPSIIHEAEAIKSNTHPPDFFALPEAGMNDEDSRKEKLVEYFKGREPRSLSRILRETDMTREDIYALADEGVLDWIALTPTDILHAQGKCDLWDEKAAQTGVRIFAGMMGISASGFLAMIECHITDLLCAAINDALENFGEPASKTLAGRTIIAIGAPVKSWMPQVNEKLDGRLFIPEYAEVANAVGAAIGQVIKSAEILIRPAKGLTTRYNLYAPWEYLSFETLEEAVQYAVPAIKNYVSGVVENTGARIVEVFESQEDLFIDSFTMESKEFVESRIRATAIGAPKYM